MTRWLAAALCALGCVRATVPTTVPVAPVASPAPELTAAHRRAQDELLTTVRRFEDRSVAARLGVALSASNGTRTLTGERSPDERLSEVEPVTTLPTAMALLARSDCGNAWIVGLRWADGAWLPAGREALVDDARPGQCRTTEARADARAMSSRQRREIVAVYGSQSDEGDERRATVLRVFQLRDDGTLSALCAPIAFGSDGDESGVVEVGEWIIDEDLDLPRDLFVEVRPRTLLPGGPHESHRRVFRLDHGALRMTHEERSTIAPSAAASSPPPVLDR